MLNRRLILTAGLGVVANCLLFAVYRLLFLLRCADTILLVDAGRVMLCGLRWIWPCSDSSCVSWG